MSTKNILASVLFASAALVAGSAMANDNPHTQPVNTPSAVSRAEVLADLEIYRESGLAAVDRTEDFSLNAGQRAQAEARYAALKASPKYAELVQRFAAKEAKGAATDGVAAR